MIGNICWCNDNYSRVTRLHIHCKTAYRMKKHNQISPQIYKIGHRKYLNLHRKYTATFHHFKKKQQTITVLWQNNSRLYKYKAKWSIHLVHHSNDYTFISCYKVISLLNNESIACYRVIFLLSNEFIVCYSDLPS